MKRFVHMLGIGFSICLLLGSQNVQAAIRFPASIELIGDAKQLSFTETDEPGFVYREAFLPGETVERTLTIKNEKNVPFRLSFELERTSEPEEFDLLERINVEVYEGERLLCTGTVDENACDTRQLYAVLKPGETRQLTMRATFDQDAGNEYKNKVAHYDWIFDAIVTEVPTTGKPTPTPTPKPPTTIVTTGKPLTNTGAYSLELFVIGLGALVVGITLKARKARRGDGR